MRIGPTIDQRIKITIDHSGDYYMLHQLVQDAGGNSSEQVVDQIGQNMDDSDWSEFVRPDLIAGFQHDIRTIAQLLQKAQEDDQKEIFISNDDARVWYSVINQARLNLENTYQLSAIEEDEIPPENCPPELAEPLIKSQLYNQVQGLILSALDW